MQEEIYLFFCKLDRFIRTNIFSSTIKQTSLQKSVSKFTPKKV